MGLSTLQLLEFQGMGARGRQNPLGNHPISLNTYETLLRVPFWSLNFPFSTWTTELYEEVYLFTHWVFNGYLRQQIPAQSRLHKEKDCFSGDRRKWFRKFGRIFIAKVGCVVTETLKNAQFVSHFVTFTLTPKCTQINPLPSVNCHVGSFFAPLRPVTDLSILG